MEGFEVLKQGWLSLGLQISDDMFVLALHYIRDFFKGFPKQILVFFWFFWVAFYLAFLGEWCKA